MKYNKNDLTTETTYLLDTINNQVFSEPAEIPKSLIDEYIKNGFELITKNEYDNHILNTPKTTNLVSNSNEKKEVVIINTKEEKPVKTQNTRSYNVKSINYSSSATVKIGESYYKFSASEEWEIHDEGNIEDIRKELWNRLNSEVDNQIDSVK